MSMAHQIKKAIKNNSKINLPIKALFKSKAYNDFSKLLYECEKWSKEEVDAWQLKMVAEMVDYAFIHVPIYREKYSSIGYESGGIRTWQDFERLPYVTKEEIKSRYNDFCSDEKDLIKHHVGFTGGSTGKAMQMLLDVDTSEREKAAFVYYWKKYGYKYGDKCIILKDQVIEETGRLYCHDSFQNYKSLSSMYVSNKSMLEQYSKEIESFGAKTIQAFPSSLYSLARNYLSSNAVPPKFGSIFLASEEIIPQQNDVIKNVFHPDYLAYHYGHTECATLAFKHPGSENSMGLVPVYGYTELVDNGNPIKSVNTVGEIVATGRNKSMPFIRYRTGDYTSYSEYTSSDWTKNYKSINLIEGRKQDYIVTKQDTLLAVVVMPNQYLKILDLVSEYQIEQFEKGKIVLKCVSFPNESISENTINLIKSKYEELLGDLIDIDVQVVTEVKKSDRGKRIAMIQHLDTDIFRNR